MKPIFFMIVSLAVGYVVWEYSAALTGQDKPWGSWLNQVSNIISFLVGFFVLKSFYHLKNVVCVPITFLGLLIGQILSSEARFFDITPNPLSSDALVLCLFAAANTLAMTIGVMARIQCEKY